MKNTRSKMLTYQLVKKEDSRLTQKTFLPGTAGHYTHWPGTGVVLQNVQRLLLFPPPLTHHGCGRVTACPPHQLERERERIYAAL